MSPDKLIQDYMRLKARQAQPSNPSGNLRCSNLAHPCDAYNYFDATVPGSQRLGASPELGMIFAEGRYQEQAFEMDLLAMGYGIPGTQGALYWEKYRISGHRDFKISPPNGGPAIRCEFKSCSPYTFDKINTVDDVRNHKLHFVRKWAGQVLLYMLLDGEEIYWLVLKNKSTGRIKVIEFRWNDDLWRDAEALLKKAERIRKWVDASSLPAEAKLADQEICARCEFFNVCLPPLHFQATASVLDDPEFAAKLDRRAELEAAASEYDEVDSEIKTQARAAAKAGTTELVCGDWLIQTKTNEVKERHIPAGTQTRVKIQKVVRGD